MKLQDTLAKYPQLSMPVSMVEVAKFSKQAFFRGNPDYYSLPNNQERNFILSYLPKFDGTGQKSVLNSFVDKQLAKNPRKRADG